MQNISYIPIGSKGFVEKENSMPPSGFSRRSVRGALEFIKGCYEDLQDEVRAGKHENFEAALEHEIGQIDSALSKLHINEKGEPVERPE
jgi:hypothetical protein